MDPMPVYDIEGEIEQAVSNLLNQGTIKINLLTSLDPPQFQKVRGRAEVSVALGATKDNHFAPSEITLQPEPINEDAWALEVRVGVITAIDDKAATHRKYLSWVRHVMNQLPALINNTVGGIVYHKIYGPVRHRGSSRRFSPQEGFYKTDMNFGMFVSVHTNAWSLIPILVPNTGATEPPQGIGDIGQDAEILGVGGEIILGVGT